MQLGFAGNADNEHVKNKGHGNNISHRCGVTVIVVCLQVRLFCCGTITVTGLFASFALLK